MIIKLDFESELPIYLQLRNQIVIGIGKGEFSIGEGLPTVRQLADDIGVNAMTVNKAYALLKSEGFISIDRRHGAKVNPIREDMFFKEKLSENLELIVAEAGMKGIAKKDFMLLCEKVYFEMNTLRAMPLTE